jgi:UDP-N-acetylmuramoylalanine--D-glutamate ligase
MIDLSSFSGDRVAVMGLGKTGLSTALALQKAGANIVAWDDNQDSRIKAEQLGIRCVDLMFISQVNTDFIVWSPGIPHSFPTPHPVAQKAKSEGIKFITDIDILSVVQQQADFIGITGTNGKSTTTALIGHTLREFRPTQVGGNIGMPVLDLEPLEHGGTYVLELSSYQTELTNDFSAIGAVFLNITPDHLSRHGGMKGYVEAKKRLFSNPKQGSRKPIAVLGIDTEETYDVAEELEEDGMWTVIPVSTQKILTQGVYVRDGILLEVRSEEPFQIADLNQFTYLRGVHNHENIACAYAVIRHVYGYEPDKIIKAMMSFTGLPHRQFLVRTINGVSYINDSKATNADAASRALVCYRHIHWILGGQPKEGGLKGLEDYKDRIAHAYLIGQATPEFSVWLREYNIPFTECGTLDVATKLAHDNVQRERNIARFDGAGVVLLSPACASWDQFQSFEHRGQVFTDLVTSL